jgi:hypothetical protein
MTDYKEEARKLVFKYEKYYRTSTEVLIDVVSVLLARINTLEKAVKELRLRELSSMRSFTEEEQKKYTESISKVYKKTGAKLFESEVEK